MPVAVDAAPFSLRASLYRNSPNQAVKIIVSCPPDTVTPAPVKPRKNICGPTTQHMVATMCTAPKHTCRQSNIRFSSAMFSLHEPWLLEQAELESSPMMSRYEFSGVNELAARRVPSIKRRLP